MATRQIYLHRMDPFGDTTKGESKLSWPPASLIPVPSFSSHLLVVQDRRRLQRAAHTHEYDGDAVAVDGRSLQSIIEVPQYEFLPNGQQLSVSLSISLQLCVSLSGSVGDEQHEFLA